MFTKMACTKAGFFIVCDNEGNVFVRPTMQEIHDDVVEEYREYARRDRGFQISSFMMASHLNLTVVEIPDTVEELTPLLENGEVSIYRMGSMMGTAHGIKLDSEVGKKLQEKGLKPAYPV